MTQVRGAGFVVRDQLVVITGGGSGIGAALGRVAAGRGARAVAVIDVLAERAETTAAELVPLGVEAAGFGCDVSLPAEVERVAGEVCDRFGSPGLVCANAGITPPSAPLWEIDPLDAAWTLGVNVTGVWATVSAFGRRMVESGAAGWLLATGSEHSIGVPHLGAGLYTASKHAVLGMMDVVRRELPETIGASVLMPGLVDTGLWQAGSRRPERFGGALRSSRHAEALMARGMSADLVAERAIAGVEAGRFLIPTHRHVATYAQERSRDMAEAFAELDVVAEGEPSYDVGVVSAEMKATRSVGDTLT